MKRILMVLFVGHSFSAGAIDLSASSSNEVTCGKCICVRYGDRDRTQKCEYDVFRGGYRIGSGGQDKNHCGCVDAWGKNPSCKDDEIPDSHEYCYDEGRAERP